MERARIPFLIALVVCGLPGLSPAQVFVPEQDEFYIGNIAPVWMAAGDLDLDGHVDVVAAGIFNESVVGFGDGAGNFTYSQEITGVIECVALADFDGDGDLDVVGSAPTGYAVRLNDGNGLFDGTGVEIPVPGSLVVAVEDLDDDSDVDLILSSGSSLRIFLGDGSGGFADTGQVLPATAEVRDIAAGDVNLDGVIDLITADFSPGGSDGYSFFAGLGNGMFSPPELLASDGTPYSLILVDIDLDGDLDLAGALTTQNSGEVYRNEGGVLEFHQKFDLDSTATSIRTGDLDSNGYPDLITGHTLGGFVSVRLNDGTGTIMDEGQEIHIEAFPGVTSISFLPQGILADVNEDGRLDLLAAFIAGNQTDFVSVHLNIAVLLQRGDATGDGNVDLEDFISTIQYLLSNGPPPACDDAADVNDDSQLDIADGIFGLAFLFGEGTPPAPPAGICGIDVTPDDLDCVDGGACAP